jgi:hypothetical protein
MISRTTALYSKLTETAIDHYSFAVMWLIHSMHDKSDCLNGFILAAGG